MVLVSVLSLVALLPPLPSPLSLPSPFPLSSHPALSSAFRAPPSRARAQGPGGHGAHPLRPSPGRGSRFSVPHLAARRAPASPPLSRSLCRCPRLPRSLSAASSPSPRSRSASPPSAFTGPRAPTPRPSTRYAAFESRVGLFRFIELAVAVRVFAGRREPGRGVGGGEGWRVPWRRERQGTWTRGAPVARRVTGRGAAAAPALAAFAFPRGRIDVRLRGFRAPAPPEIAPPAWEAREGMRRRVGGDE